MPRGLAVLVLLVSVAVAFGNAAPPRYIPCEREVKLAKAAPGYAFYTLRKEDKDAELSPLKLTADARTALPVRKTDKAENAVLLYCVPNAEVERHASAGELLAAIRAGKAAHSQLPFYPNKIVFPTWKEHGTRPANHVGGRDGVRPWVFQGGVRA